MNIRLMKQCDSAIGRIAVSLLSSPMCNSTEARFSSILIIRPGGSGDAVMLAPAIHSLKNTYPAVHITILAERRNAGVFPLIPGVDTLLCYDRPAELIQVLRRSYDVVIDTEQWHRLSAVVARLVQAPVKIGFNTNERRRMFTHSIPYSHDDYEVDSFIRLLEPLGIDAGAVEMKAPFLHIPDDVAVRGAELVELLCNDPFVVIFPGASIPERRWGGRGFGQVAIRLAEDGFRIVVVGGQDDWDEAVTIAGDRGLNLAGKTTLAETAAVIARATLVISGDSGVLHLAAGLDVPTVSLFGPGIAAKWAPQGERHIVINHQLACSPCTKFGTTPPCPVNARCIREITPDEVMAAIGRLLVQPPKT